jgi:hypothetical protein
MSGQVEEFLDDPTHVDIQAPKRARDDFAAHRRAEFYRAAWELDDLTESWQSKASNYSDDFSADVKTVKVSR